MGSIIDTRPYFPWNTGCLIGILIMVYYHPYIPDSIIPYITLNKQGPCFIAHLEGPGIHTSSCIFGAGIQSMDSLQLNWFHPLHRLKSLSKKTWLILNCLNGSQNEDAKPKKIATKLGGSPKKISCMKRFGLVREPHQFGHNILG